MVALVPASIVVIPFPFSDLSGAKLRPAVALTETGYDDWLLCQITSNPYSGASLRLTDAELSRGTLKTVSYARPMKLFTANAGLIVKRVAILKDQAFNQLIRATPATIYEVLKTWLAAGGEERHTRGQMCRKYVEMWHDPLHIAAEVKADYEAALAKKRDQAHYGGWGLQMLWGEMGLLSLKIWLFLEVCHNILV